MGNRHSKNKARLDGHSRGRASERYQLEQHEVDLLRKRVRRFFHEGQHCHGNDIVVIEQQSRIEFRIAILMRDEWIHVVYHVRYCVFVTFLSNEDLVGETLRSIPVHTIKTRVPDRVEKQTRAQI